MLVLGDGERHDGHGGVAAALPCVLPHLLPVGDGGARARVSRVGRVGVVRRRRPLLRQVGLLVVLLLVVGVGAVPVAETVSDEHAHEDEQEDGEEDDAGDCRASEVPAPVVVAAVVPASCGEHGRLLIDVVPSSRVVFVVVVVVVVGISCMHTRRQGEDELMDGGRVVAHFASRSRPNKT